MSAITSKNSKFERNSRPLTRPKHPSRTSAMCLCKLPSERESGRGESQQAKQEPTTTTTTTTTKAASSSDNNEREKPSEKRKVFRFTRRRHSWSVCVCVCVCAFAPTPPSAVPLQSLHSPLIRATPFSTKTSLHARLCGCCSCPPTDFPFAG